MNGTDTADARDLAAVFTRFAENEARTTPLYESLARTVAGSPALLDLAARTNPSQRPPNMLFGAVQFLLLRDWPDDPLTAFYSAFRDPPAPPAEAGPHFADFCRRHEAEIAGILQSRSVNTNEPARAAVLRPLAAEALARVDGPLHWIEIGCSAGLLLLWPHYAVDYGRCGRAGPAQAPITLDCEVRGEGCPPSTVDPDRLGRMIGIDVTPPDPSDPDDALWLRALIWPEHRERAARLDAALRVAAATGVDVRRGDALELLPRLAAELPEGEPLAVVHAFLLAQLGADGRAALDRALRETARERPVLRLGYDWAESAAEASITDYRQAEPTRRVLGRADAHGKWIAWADS